MAPILVGPNPLRVEWNLAGRFVVGYSGNLGLVHDSSAVIDAAERLRDHASVVFVFIGGGTRSDALRVEVARRRLTNVVFKPYQQRETLAISLTLPDVHLVSVRPEFEGMVLPSKIYGVMAAGRPCIFIGDVQGDVACLLRDEECGVTVPVGDGAALAQAILSLYDHPMRRKSMGAAARQAFEVQFDMPVALARWDKVLEVVARRNV